MPDLHDGSTISELMELVVVVGDEASLKAARKREQRRKEEAEQLHESLQHRSEK
jgi:hypothetical protein